MHNPRRPLPPLDLVRGFEAAARRLSFTQAAQELFVTQSAVSRQVQALEEFLGVKLFERRHKALELTEAGQAYYRAAAAALAELRAATQRVRESTRGHVLTVTTTGSFASIWLVPRLGRFRQAHPGIDVRIAATHLTLDLAREGIDVAIRDVPSGKEPPGSVRLVGERLCPVASPAYLRESKAPLAQPADLRHHVMLLLHDPQGRWPWLSWAAWLEANGVADLVPGGTLAYDQYDQVVNAAVHGQGVALGRMSVVDSLVEEGKLVAPFGKRMQVPRALHAIYAPGAENRPEARAFVDWLRREIA
ncbi:MAG: transcriptional regulator GcvA [Betaproteobacteria bacterium]|nr:transcriptional regulator GcvA [Betaproteobacteria bacterium]PWB66917.1 MAG: LysR family transcriptional regulator [Betaproteobacteria bacterium]